MLVLAFVGMALVALAAGILLLSVVYLGMALVSFLDPPPEDPNPYFPQYEWPGWVVGGVFWLLLAVVVGWLGVVVFRWSGRTRRRR